VTQRWKTLTYALCSLAVAAGCSTNPPYVPEPKPDVPVDNEPAPDAVDMDVPTFPDVPRPDAAKDAAPEATADAADEPPPPPDVTPPPDVMPPPDVTADAPCRTRCGGFCTDPDTDPENCGACGNDCTLRPGVDISRVRCVAGRCDFTGACLPGRANCSGVADDGCEAMVNTATRCGSCTTMCSAAAPTCMAMAGAPGGFGCSSGCSVMGQARCAGTCVDIMTDARNCGACGTVCPAIGGAAACVAGRCSITCPAGTGDCDGNTANGCETSTRSNLMNCGMCGNACPAGPAGATPFCSVGVCNISCTAGNGNCDMNAANGCETDLRTSAMNCGACGNACATGPGGASTCVAGSCQVTCNPGFGNCNFSVVDGCEADLNTNPLHCGACNRRCAAATNATAACAAGSCGIACLTNFGNCDGNGLNGCETPLASDPLNCGACGMRCPSAPGAAATCAAGRCALACMTGQGDCDGMIANGCETDVTRSVTNCGMCGRACNAPSNGRATCESSACVILCDDGYMLSGAMCVRAPPRPVAPAGGAFVTTRRPTFRVALVPGSTGARIEVCGDRACTSVATTLMATGNSVTSSATLTPGVYYWRVAGTSAGSVVTPVSAVTEFAVVAGASAPTSSTWGPFLDANGDRYADVLVGLPSLNRVQYWNNLGGAFSSFSFTTIVSAAPSFGTAVAAAGDVNADGYSDAVVGAPSANQAFIYNGGVSGLLTTATTTLNAPSGVSRFGASVASAGDVNGDGYGDVLVGAPGTNRAYLYFGRAVGLNDTMPVTLLPTGAGANFGVSVAGIGDVNADGYADIAVGTDGASIVYVWFGGASGLGTTPTGISAPAGANGFGRAVAGAGDVNGDGYPDVIIGAYNSATAYIFRGGSGGLATTPASTLAGGSATLGLTVDGAGDVNGDGFGDVIVGAPTGDNAYIYNGNATGVTATPATVLPKTYVGFQFGTAVSGFGDFNLDGFSDVLVGSPSRAIQFFRGSTAGAVTYTTFTGSTSFGQSIASLFRRFVTRS
jgi:hypothetical protein